MQLDRNYRTLLLAVAIEPTEIGRRIREARDRKGWTQLDLALEAGSSVSSVQRWEAGELPRIKRLFTLADLLDVDVDDFVRQDEPDGSSQDQRLETLLDRLEQIVEGLEGGQEQPPNG